MSAKPRHQQRIRALPQPPSLCSRCPPPALDVPVTLPPPLAEIPFFSGCSQDDTKCQKQEKKENYQTNPLSSATLARSPAETGLGRNIHPAKIQMGNHIVVQTTRGNEMPDSPLPRRQPCRLVLAAGLLLMAASANGQSIIVDNLDPEFTDLSGTWSTFVASGQWRDDYVYRSTDGTPGVVEWRPELPLTGDYVVAVWYRSTGSSRPNNATYTIHHAAGSDPVVVNQQINGSTWVVLGTYPFNAGTDGRVTLTSAAEPGKTIVADAVYFRGPAEWRAMWAYSWGSGFLNPTQTTSMINTLAANHYNVIIPQIRRAGDAHYVSNYEPPASNLQSGYDALADIITKAHAAGIEVHPWIVAYRIWNTNFGAAPANHPFTAHPEWLAEDSSGNLLDGSNYYLDPGVPKVQQYVVNVVMDIVDRYDVDGFNFDYIRYQAGNWGYNAISQQRFLDEFGVLPPTSSASPMWSTWSQWRRNQITDLVRKSYVHIMASKPWVVVTCDSITWGSVGTYISSDTYAWVFQDWRGWMDEHIIDAMLPMNYKVETTHAGQYRDWANFAMMNKNGRHAYIGQGAYTNTIANTLTQIADVRTLGSDGQCQYQYQTTNNEGATSATFFANMTSQLYTAPVPTPPMPWKDNPTLGILGGTITDASMPNDPIYGDWIYKATVDLTGPVSRSMPTDATGFYAFTDLPPGDYTVSINHVGFEPKTLTDQAVAAGQVTWSNAALVHIGFAGCGPQMLSDFDAYTPDTGVQVMFRHPSYSGSTSTDLAVTPNSTQVVSTAAYSGTNSTEVQWQWLDTDPQRWLRLTTHNVANMPNPTVDLRRPIRLRLRLDAGTLRVCVGVRETGTAAAIGEDGGAAGDIEWIGATSTLTGAPQGRLIEALPGEWQTLVFDPLIDPILGMTGNGVIASATDRGTLEHVAFSVVDDAGPFTVYIDNVEQLCVPGDWDGDSVVDLTDYAHFAPCMTLPGAEGVNPECQVFDTDDDQDVDLRDFAAVQTHFMKP